MRTSLPALPQVYLLGSCGPLQEVGAERARMISDKATSLPHSPF